MDVNTSRRLRLFDDIDSIKCTLTSLGKKSKGYESRHVSPSKSQYGGNASVSTSQPVAPFSSQLPPAYAFDDTYVRPVAEEKGNNPFSNPKPRPSFGVTHPLSSLSTSTPVNAPAPATPGNREHTLGTEDLFFGHTTSEVNEINPHRRVRIAPASSESPGNGPASINELILASGEYTDVTFITSDGKEIGAHRCFMVLASPVLKAAFARDGPMSVVHVSFPEDVTRLAIRYAYGCNVSITDKEAPALLQFARTYGMSDLEQECLPHVDVEINIDLSNAVELLESACLNNQEDLKTKCVSFIAANKEALKDKLRNLSSDLIFEIFFA